MKFAANGQSSLVARSAGSPCRMEGLEPRLLLANELIVGLGDAIFKEPQLPGDKIDIPVTFQNVSGAQVSGKIHIRIFASDDGGSVDLDQDFLIADKFVNINPRPNQIQTKTVKGQFPLDMLPEDYQLIVVVDEGDSMLPAGVTFAVSADIDEEIFDLRWQFGTVSGRSGNTTLRFMNNSGVTYKVNFSEGFDHDGEFGEVESFVDVLLREDRGTPIPGDQIIDLLFDNTGFDDRISVRRTGGPSDPNLFYLTGIESDGPRGGIDNLGFFDASDLTLYGPASFSGGLHKLYLGNLMNAGIVAINLESFSLLESQESAREIRGGTDPFDRVSIKVRDVVGTAFLINQTLANMKADSFSGLLEEFLSERGKIPKFKEVLGGIAANLIDKVNIRNDFEGAVSAVPLFLARGALFPEGSRAINEFVVGGTMTGAMFTFGDVGKLQVGAIGEFEGAILGRLERLIVKGDVGQLNHPEPLRGSPFHTFIGATNISRVDIGGDVIESSIFAGLPEESIGRGPGFFLVYLFVAGGALYDGKFDFPIGDGEIGRINVGGDVLASQFGAGVDPDGSPFFFDGFLVGDSSVSHIGPVKVGGVVSGYQGAAPSFISGDFPDTASINGSTVTPATDSDFLVVFPI